MASSKTKPIILHIGDPIKYNTDLYAKLCSRFTVIRPAEEERHRPEFMKALQEGRWGDFDAICRPFWNTGGEMGRWDRELIPLLPKSVKVFASAGAGYDWADVDVLAEYGILYCNGASASSEAVADMALYHILSVFRNLTWSALAARSCSPDEFLDAHRHSPATAHNPRGQILGIIGLGNIGSTIAAKAHAAFGMRIHYHDVARKSPAQESAVSATFVADLDDLVATADCVVLATPFSGSQLLTASTLARFKPGSRLVNIARGSLVDEPALVHALRAGRLAAAGLDVHADEPRVNPELAAMRNVTLTCHTAGGALETVVGFERLAMENVERVLTGCEALTGVNRHLLK